LFLLLAFATVFIPEGFYSKKIFLGGMKLNLQTLQCTLILINIAFLHKLMLISVPLNKEILILLLPAINPPIVPLALRLPENHTRTGTDAA